MASWRDDIIEINLTTIIRQRVIVNAILDAFVEYRENFNRDPTGVRLVDFPKLQQLTLLDLEMDDTIMFHKAKSGYNPET